MTRYAAGLVEVLQPDPAVGVATAGHLNLRGPMRRLMPAYRHIEPLPRRWPRKLDLVHLTDVYLSVHAGRFNAARVTTLHDMIPWYYSNWRSLATTRWRLAFLRSLRGLKNSDAVITPSEHARAELLKNTNLEPDRVHAVPILVPDAIAPPPAGSKREAGTILSIGTTAAYKNLPLLLEAFARPELKGARLVRIGSGFDYGLPAMVERLGLADRITHLGQVSEARLIRAFQESTVLAQPSLVEGFGMPVAEAMCAGLPVVTSNGGSLPEVVRDGGKVVPLRKLEKGPVDMDDARDLARALAEVLETPDLQRTLSEAALREAPRFRAPAIRAELLAAYDRAMDVASVRTGS
jgi:glycosyltransferase involved in cell wall biosynthesis